MGGKRRKLKDIISPPSNAPAPVATADDELLDDLFAQLDSNDSTVQNVSAEVINDIQLSQLQEKKEPRKLKKDSRTRFLERQVCTSLRTSVARTMTSLSRRERPQESLNIIPPTTLSWMPGLKGRQKKKTQVSAGPANFSVSSFIMSVCLSPSW